MGHLSAFPGATWQSNVFAKRQNVDSIEAKTFSLVKTSLKRSFTNPVYYLDSKFFRKILSERGERRRPKNTPNIYVTAVTDTGAITTEETQEILTNLVVENENVLEPSEKKRERKFRRGRGGRGKGKQAQNSVSEEGAEEGNGANGVKVENSNGAVGEGEGEGQGGERNLEGSTDSTKSESGLSDAIKTKEEKRSNSWRKAKAMMEYGGLHRGKVEGCNNGGLLVRFSALQGFLPFSQLDPARLSEGVEGEKKAMEVGQAMVGETVTTLVTDVVEGRRRLILSEKKAIAAKKLQKIKKGDIVLGQVSYITDFGAFVDVKFPDGSGGLSGLVHMSELSWDAVRTPWDVLEPGKEVQVKVIGIDRTKKRLALSLKQTQADPLLETLDTLMPASANQTPSPEGESAPESQSEAELLRSPLPGLAGICEELLREDGISGVTLGRQAVERRVVSQDLELWLSNALSGDKVFTLLARAGRQVQEVHVSASLDREEMIKAVQRVTGRVL